MGGEEGDGMSFTGQCSDVKSALCRVAPGPDVALAWKLSVCSCQEEDAEDR